MVWVGALSTSTGRKRPARSECLQVVFEQLHRACRLPASPLRNPIALVALRVKRRGPTLEARRQMTTAAYVRYRGYKIVPMRQWSQWCAGVYPTRADLPILSSSTLRTLRPRKAEALEAARKRIDRKLSYSH